MAHVLILDDSLTIRMDLRDALEEAGHTATPCATAREARLALSHKNIDLIVLDRMLSDADGLEFLRELKGGRATRRVPVLMLTASPLLSGDGAAPDAVLDKPYSRDHLLKHVERLARRSATALCPGPNSPPPGKRILAIDDSPTYLDQLAEHLRSAGYEVVPAGSGEEGLKRLMAESIDCILLDLMMEGLGGVETCRRIKSMPAWRTIPVLMLTSSEDREAMIRSFDAGADDYIPKSVDITILKAHVCAQLRRRAAEEDSGRIREQLHLKEIEATAARAHRELAEMRIALLADLERKNEALQRSQQELHRAKDAAELANSRKDQFLAVLSHELRTPLTPVVARLELLLREPELPAEVRGGLEMIRRNVELESRLIDDLLDITCILRGTLSLDLQPVDAHEKIQDALDIHQDQIEQKRQCVQLELGAGSHHVRADPVRLQQVFWNLIGNASKYTPENGRITVRTLNAGDEAARRRSGEPEEAGRPKPGTENSSRPLLVIEIADSGIGIEPEAMERIFLPFEQGEQSLSRQFGGMGLGLSISRTLVELQDGRLEAASVGTGQGSTFTVSFATIDPPQAPPQAPAAPRRERRACLRVLLVEDQPDTLRTLARLLEVEGYEVRMAATVAEARAAIVEQPFDVLISDIGLPDGTGWELMQSLPDKTFARSIALSGYATEDDIRRSREAGFDEHLAKPVNPQALLDAVSQPASRAPRA
jgi:DNA-binding response OmpR family regulator